MLPKAYSNDFYFEVAKGQLNGYSAMQLTGKNADVDGVEDLWNQGGNIVRASSAALLYVSSSNAADIDLEVTVTGLDANYDEVTEVITTHHTDARTRVAGTTLFLRVNSVTMSVAPAGNIYVYYLSTVTGGVPDDASKIQAKVNLSTTEAYNMIYTAPRDKNLYLTSLKYYSTGSTTTHVVILTVHVKRYGESEVNAIQIQYTDPNNGFYSFETKPIEIPARADFDIEVSLDGGTNMNITAIADFVVEDVEVTPIMTSIMTKSEYDAYLTGGGLTVASTKLYLIGLDEYPTVAPTSFDLLQLLNPGGITGTTSFVVAATTDVYFDSASFSGGLLISTTKKAVLCLWRAVDSGGGVKYVNLGVNNLINLKNTKKVTFVAA
jgi:hypothetical protein